MDDPVVAVFKLGQRIHMEELLHEGHVFMNPLSHFAQLEKESPRADRDEGTAYCRQATDANLKIQDNEQWQTVGTLIAPIRVRTAKITSANLYCLHARKRSQCGDLLDLDRLGFGDSYVLFRDADEFFRRIRCAAEQAGHEIRIGLVDYVDRRAFDGPLGVFHKFSDHSHESELWAAILPGTGSPLSLRLGDLSDIAMMGSTSDRLRLEPQ